MDRWAKQEADRWVKEQFGASKMGSSEDEGAGPSEPAPVALGSASRREASFPRVSPERAPPALGGTMDSSGGFSLGGEAPAGSDEQVALLTLNAYTARRELVKMRKELARLKQGAGPGGSVEGLEDAVRLRNQAQAQVADGQSATDSDSERLRERAQQRKRMERELVRVREEAMREAGEKERRALHQAERQIQNLMEERNREDEESNSKRVQAERTQRDKLAREAKERAEQRAVSALAQSVVAPVIHRSSLTDCGCDSSTSWRCGSRSSRVTRPRCGRPRTAATTRMSRRRSASALGGWRVRKRSAARAST